MQLLTLVLCRMSRFLEAAVGSAADCPDVTFALPTDATLAPTVPGKTSTHMMVSTTSATPEVFKGTSTLSLATQTDTTRKHYEKHPAATMLAIGRMARAHGILHALQEAKFLYPDDHFKHNTVGSWLAHLDEWEARLKGGLTVEKAVKSIYHKTRQRGNEIPTTVKEDVRTELLADAKAFKETTTDAVRRKFEEKGVFIKQSALYQFCHDLQWSLLTQKPRSAKELTKESLEETKERIYRFWDTIAAFRTDEQNPIKPDNIISFDEKPMWAERHSKRKIWRPRASGPAYVASGGREKLRDTVIMITDGSGRKYPLVFNFRGKYQRKVHVPKGFPTLVCHTKTAMSNSDFIIFIIERAIIPNLTKGQIYLILLDDHPSHFSETVQAWMAKQTNLRFAKIECPLTK